MGKYKVMTGEFADLMLGYYGECPGERNPEVIERAQTQTKKPPITERPADLLAPEWDSLVDQAKALEGFDGSEEDVLTVAMVPQVAATFLKERPQGPRNVGMTDEQVEEERRKAAGLDKALHEPIKYTVTIDGRSRSVSVEPA